MIYGERVERATAPSKWTTVRSFKKCNIDDLLSDLTDAPWHVMETFTSVDDKYDYWKTLFLSIIDKHAPLVKVRMKKDSCEWIDEDIRRLMRARNYYRRKYQKMRNPEDWKMFKGLRNEVNRQMRQAKVGHFSRLCQELSNKPGRVWRQLNLSIGRKVKRLVTSLKCI